MQRPLLSISVPTFNRADRLNGTLRSVLAQIEALAMPPGTIEVVVTSNASTDRTREVVQALAAENPAIRYFENESNLGIDGNIHRAVVNAQGTYVHLLSDDDVLLPGLYARLRDDLNANDDIHFMWLNVRPLGPDGGAEGPPIVPRATQAVSRMTPDDLIDTVGVWMTFISSFVVRRESWLATSNPEQHIGTDIYLSYVAFEIVAAAGHGHLSGIPSILVRPMYSGSFRIFKAFAQEWRRLLLDFAPRHGFDKAVTRRMLMRTTRQFLPGCVMIAKRSATLTRQELWVLMRNTWDLPSAWLFVYPVIVLPTRVLRLLRKTWKKVRGQARPGYS